MQRRQHQLATYSCQGHGSSLAKGPGKNNLLTAEVNINSKSIKSLTFFHAFCNGSRELRDNVKEQVMNTGTDTCTVGNSIYGNVCGSLPKLFQIWLWKRHLEGMTSSAISWQPSCMTAAKPLEYIVRVTAPLLTCNSHTDLSNHKDWLSLDTWKTSEQCTCYAASEICSTSMLTKESGLKSQTDMREKAIGTMRLMLLLQANVDKEGVIPKQRRKGVPTVSKV